MDAVLVVEREPQQAITAPGQGVRQMRHVGCGTGELGCALVPRGLKTAGRQAGRVLLPCPRPLRGRDLAADAGRAAGLALVRPWPEAMATRIAKGEAAHPPRHP